MHRMPFDRDLLRAKRDARVILLSGLHLKASKEEIKLAAGKLLPGVDFEPLWDDQSKRLATNLHSGWCVSSSFHAGKQQTKP